MAGRVAYLDSSAFVKLIVNEAESAALRRALLRWPEWTSAALLRTEAVRALRRTGDEEAVAKARSEMRAMHLVQADEALFDHAGELEPVGLRSLDAIHLATALRLGNEVGVMFAYDLRLRKAAEAYGLEVVSPE